MSYNHGWEWQEIELEVRDDEWGPPVGERRRGQREGMGRRLPVHAGRHVGGNRPGIPPKG